MLCAPKRFRSATCSTIIYHHSPFVNTLFSSFLFLLSTCPRVSLFATISCFPSPFLPQDRTAHDRPFCRERCPHRSAGMVCRPCGTSGATFPTQPLSAWTVGLAYYTTHSMNERASSKAADKRVHPSDGLPQPLRGFAMTPFGGVVGAGMTARRNRHEQRKMRVIPSAERVGIRSCGEHVPEERASKKGTDCRGSRLPARSVLLPYGKGVHRTPAPFHSLAMTTPLPASRQHRVQ